MLLRPPQSDVPLEVATVAYVAVSEAAAIELDSHHEGAVFA